MARSTTSWPGSTRIPLEQRYFSDLHLSPTVVDRTAFPDQSVGGEFASRGGTLVSRTGRVGHRVLAHAGQLECPAGGAGTGPFSSSLGPGGSNADTKVS